MFVDQRDRTSPAPAARTLPSEDEVVIDIIPLGAPPWADLALWRRQRKIEQSSLAEAFVKSFDYTMNALYYDPAGNVIIDFVNGVDDVRNRTLRLVRPGEFPLDMVSVLRGVVQCSKKDLRIDDVTWDVMCRWASTADLRVRKPARLFSQMVKMLGSGVAAPCFELLERMGAMKVLWGRRTMPHRELAPVRRLLSALDRVSAPGLEIAVLFATLFYHPIELALGRLGARPATRSRASDDWARHERALADGIEASLRPLAESFAMPQAIYKETHKALLAVRLMRDGRSAEHWRGAQDAPWWKGAARLREIVRRAG